MENKYPRKIRSEIAIDILSVLAVSGLVVIALTSPYLLRNLIRGFAKTKKYSSKKVYNTFHNLKEKGLINFDEKNGQLFISLTKEGKNKAGWMQIDKLNILKPKKWDRKWRIVIFDISETKKEYREALRGKLKQLGFYLLQKSTWAIPYECSREINLLKNFFGLKDYEIRLIVADSIGNEKEIREFFKL